MSDTNTHRPMLYARTCRACSHPFGAAYYNVKYCPTCGPAERREYMRLYQQRRRADPEERAADAARGRAKYHENAPRLRERQKEYRKRWERERRARNLAERLRGPQTSAVLPSGAWAEGQ